MIALVDDQEANRHALARSLGEAGYLVQEGSSGQDALTLARQEPDLMILKANLAETRGIEICQELKRHPSTANILIVLTSAIPTSPQERVHGLECGADAYLSAPFEPRELIAQVKALLRIKTNNLARRQRGECFRCFLMDNPDPFFSVDPQGRFVQVNAACEVISGYASAELLKRTFVEICAPDQRDQTLAAFYRGLKEGHPQRLETALIRKDGQRADLLVTGSAVLCENQVAQLYCTAKDITARKRTEEALRRSEERFRLSEQRLVLAQEAGGVGVYDWNLETGDIVWTAQLEKIYGFTAPEEGSEKQQAWLRHVHAEDRARLTKDTRDWLDSTQNDHCWEYRFIRPDGQERWISGQSIVFRDHENRPLRVVGTNVDITDRKRAEQAVRDQEAKLRLAVEGARIGLWSLEMATGKRDCTPLTLELWGFNASAPLPTEEEWFARIHPEDRQRVIDLYQTSIASVTPYYVEHRILWPDNSVHWLESRATPDMGADGHPVRFIGITLEATERKRAEERLKQSEARYRELVQNANSAIIRWKADGTITFFNEFAQQFFGYREEEVLGQPASMLVPPVESTGKDLSSLVQDIVAHPQRYIQNINENICHDGRRVWMVWTNRPLFNEQGQLTEILTVGGDITERKLAEDEIRKLNADLDQRVRMRTADLQRLTQQLRKLAKDLTLSEEREKRRTAHVLHENLQQLLVAAQFRLQGLQKPNKDPAGKDELRVVLRILDESIHTSRSLTYELSPPVLQELNLAAALRWLGRWFEERHDFQVRIQADQTVDIAAEELRITLFRSVQELLFNAVKHAQVKTAQVTVRQMPGPALEIVVCDDGRGFDPAQLSTPESTETGFGLFHLREQLESLGGQFRIDSAPGQGSRFTLFVPGCLMSTPAPSESEAASILPVQPPPPSPSSERRKIHLLLADDHHLIREGLVRIMQEHGAFEVVGQAADGQQAVELAHALQPDVILMDVSMPRLNGIEATRIIKTELPHIKIIGLSMFEDEAHSAAMRNAGALTLLPKSSPSTDLVSTILQHVQPGT